ncbi:MAG: type I-E CRISPR-associated protein Cas5/CasD [Chloroflexota bacterium]|nr:type I-E CRISPR-associated protein Cas5/CasD [Chloroflexota bacterium]
MSRQYLILVLQAPLIAYGDEAIDRRRPTDSLPGKSMLTGLLGNALGYRRQDADKLEDLQRRLEYAARSETGQYLNGIRDFHTARLGIDDRAWTTYGKPEGRAGDRKNPQVTETREVHYLAETASVVALTLRDPSKSPSLGELLEAVKKPARPLFIGRKCCIPERPVFERMINAESATEALHLTPAVTGQASAQVQWDEPEEHDSVKLTHQTWVSDLKDWDNGIHVGRRLVKRGVQTLTVAQPHEAGAGT